jgi:hypothetical protein
MRREELINYARHMNCNDNVLHFINTLTESQLSNTSDCEHIIDYLAHKQFDNLSWASYDLLLAKSHKWIAQLSRNVSRIDESEGVDFEVALDFEDGFRFVKLLSEASYQREGALMSHCVASYYGKNTDIYSLRDSFNKPHCTIEKDMQIKGKGNGDISPKYIHYVVAFLEHMGMKVRESEMSHLGYKKVEFPQYCINDDLFRSEYIRNDKEEKYDYDKVIIFTDIDKAVKYKGDKICLFSGDAYFSGSSITHLGQLQSIGGNADFEDSNITDLGELQSIGGYADFRGSKITHLGKLQSIGDDADFRGSKITHLGNLQSIGGGAYFKYSNVISLGNLQSIGGNSDFRGSNITSLGNLQSIGGDADFRYSKFTSLGNLQSIGSDAYFKGSKLNKDQIRKLNEISRNND